MHILVSFCNLRAPCLPALAVLDPVSMAYRVVRLPEVLAHIGGFTGLACWGPYLCGVVQLPVGRRGESALITFDRGSLSVLAIYPFRVANDVHSLWPADDVLYAVSAGTDEVIRLRRNGAAVVAEEVCWRIDTTGPRQDVHHLNAVCLCGGELLVSGFGRKEGSAWESARQGFILNTTRGQTLVSGIDQPHSLLPLGGEVAFCESRRGEVRLGAVRSLPLPGYTRGLAVADGKLFAATSVGRQVSRHTGAVIDNSAGRGTVTGHCTVSRLSLPDCTVEATADLTPCAAEIYDLLPVPETGAWPLADELAWRNDSLSRLGLAFDGVLAQARQALRGAGAKWNSRKKTQKTQKAEMA